MNGIVSDTNIVSEMGKILLLPMRWGDLFLQCSSQRVIGPYPESDESNRSSYTISSNLISISFPV